MCYIFMCAYNNILIEYAYDTRILFFEKYARILTYSIFFIRVSLNFDFDIFPLISRERYCVTSLSGMFTKSSTVIHV